MSPCSSNDKRITPYDVMLSNNVKKVLAAALTGRIVNKSQHFPRVRDCFKNRS